MKTDAAFWVIALAGAMLVSAVVTARVIDKMQEYAIEQGSRR